jgi:hypothetical protein
MAEEPFRTIIEPFRIHSVEPMRLTTRSQREGAAPAGRGRFPALTAGRMRSTSPSRPGRRDLPHLAGWMTPVAPGPGCRHFRPQPASAQVLKRTRFGM